MAYCSKCNMIVQEKDKFCSNCGASHLSFYTAGVLPRLPIQLPPKLPPYEPMPPRPNKAMGFVGMGFGIGSMVMLAMALFCLILGLAFRLMEGIGYGVLIPISSSPYSIVGLVLCAKSLRSGNKLPSCKAGFIMGMVGTFAFAAALFFIIFFLVGN